MKKIDAYRCDHCKRVTTTQRAMKTHEERCIHNPAQRTCCTCEHDVKGQGCIAGARPESVILIRGCVRWAPAEGFAA